MFYVFDNLKNIRVYQDPWPYAIIDDALDIRVADYIRDNFPEYNTLRDNSFFRISDGPIKMEDEIFRKFFKANWYNREKLVQQTHDLFSLKNENAEFSRLNYALVNPGDPKELVRDWHVDMPHKKFQFILYLGTDSSDTTFEMGTSLNGPVHTPLDFKHNRLLIWPANDKSFHRFYKTKEMRKTINLTIEHGPKYNYKGIPSEYIP